MTKRERIYNKFGGLCAYSGTPLEADWQIDHVEPIRRNLSGNGCLIPENENDKNLVPCQKIINHYKGSLFLSEFRKYRMEGLHERVKKLPKNPRTEKGQRRKDYILKVAGYFEITEDGPFSGKFYFETVE